MEFSEKNIQKTNRNNSIIINSGSSYSSSGSGGSVNSGVLDLIETINKVNSGVVLSTTGALGTHGKVTGDKAIYNLISTTGNTDAGWIYGLTESVGGTTKHVASLSAKGEFTTDELISNGLTITNGLKSVKLVVDGSGHLVVDGSIYSSGEVVAFSDGSDVGGTGTGGLITQVFGLSDLGQLFDSSNLANTFNAFTINAINDKVNILESKPDVSVEGLASFTYVDTAISNLIGGAPTTLNTLDELAQAMSDDAAMSVTLINLIGTKAPISHYHTKSQISDFPTSLSQFINNLGNYGNFATATELNNGLAGKLAATGKATDSEKLDGYDSTYFQPLSTAINTGNIANQSVSFANNSNYADVATFDINGQYITDYYISIDNIANQSVEYAKNSAYSDVSGNSSKLDGLDSSYFQPLSGSFNSDNSNLSSVDWNAKNLYLGDYIQANRAFFANQVVSGDAILQDRWMGADEMGVFSALGDEVIASWNYGADIYNYANGKLSIGPTGFVLSGNTNITGNITTTGEVTAFSTSDSRLKENIKPIENSLDIINQLNPVVYNWNEKAKELNQNKTDKVDSGLIAQELQKVLPNVVGEMYNGEYLGVDYVKLIPYLIGAIQELNKELDALKNK